MNIKGKVIRSKDDQILLKCEIGPGFVDDVELGELLEEFEGQNVYITINSFKTRNYSKNDEFTDGGELVE